VGVVLISVVEVGFIFSGNVGTGIMLRKKSDGTWSSPSACGMTGVGFGFTIGASLKDLIVFVMEEPTFEGMTANTGLKLGTQSEMTLGPLGRTYQFDANMSPKNFGPTVAVAFSKGAFLGMSAEGAVLGVRDKVNKTFYGRDITPKEILYDDSVKVPDGKVTLLDEVHAKLEKLANRVAEEDPEASDAEKCAAALAAAESAGELSKSDPDVIEVDASAEAAKEQS
jgi:lipid-binding SYLF domain-containing protein